MNQKWMIGSVLGFVVVLGSCEKPAPPDTRAADEKAIRALEEEWSKAAMAKDATKFAGYYAPDASLYIPGAPAMHGKAAIADGLKTAMSDPNFSLSFKTAQVHVAKSGDLACSEGTYEETGSIPVSKKKVEEKGNYVTCYSKQADGTWKAIADITTIEGSPAPPPAAKPHHAPKKKKR